MCVCLCVGGVILAHPVELPYPDEAWCSTPLERKHATYFLSGDSPLYIIHKGVGVGVYSIDVILKVE